MLYGHVLSRRGCDLWMHTSSTNNPRDLCGATSWLCIILDECLYLMISRQKSSWKIVQTNVIWVKGEKGGKQSVIIYSWLFTHDRVIQAEGLITWCNLRSTVTVPSSSSSSSTSVSSTPFSSSSSCFSSSFSSLLYCTLNSPSKRH